MTLGDEIKAHAKFVAKDLKAGKASAHSRRAMEFMDETPEAVLSVIDLVHREVNRKKPNDAIVQAYVNMFANGLERIRYEVERGQDWAEELVESVRELLILLTKGGIIPPHLLMLLLNGFIEAKLAPGDVITLKPATSSGLLLHVEGRPKFRALRGKVEGRLAVQVLDRVDDRRSER